MAKSGAAIPSHLPGKLLPLQYRILMETAAPSSVASPPLVAIVSWLVPGAGYLLLGQRGRAMGVGITIILLFLMGILIAGVRVIEVPGYDPLTGLPVMTSVFVQAIDPITKQPRVDERGQRVIAQAIDPTTNRPLKHWALTDSPLNEIREKPWSVPQVMTGPIAVAAGAWSVHAAGLDPAAPGGQIGAMTHARINEIGSLYLSVAGLLNLMAIIDATWRASHLNERLPNEQSPKESA